MRSPHHSQHFPTPPFRDGFAALYGRTKRGGSNSLKWRAPSERIRTASEIPIEVDLTDEDAVPVYKKISEKVLHLRRLGMAYATIAERLEITLWMGWRKNLLTGARPINWGGRTLPVNWGTDGDKRQPPPS